MPKVLHFATLEVAATAVWAGDSVSTPGIPGLRPNHEFSPEHRPKGAGFLVPCGWRPVWMSVNCTSFRLLRSVISMMEWRTVTVRVAMAALCCWTPAQAADDVAPLPDRAGVALIAEIDEQIRTAWTDNEITPSPAADDAEWLRRVHLDLVGHIPSVEVTAAFMEDKAEDKRVRMVDTLLEDPHYVRTMTTVWANTLLGRVTPERTSRAGMEKFLRESFARRRPWNEIVYEMLTAEGHFEENGAVNFLLAQLQGNPGREDYTVEATARATRVLLGLQVQCTQCHDHPFNTWKQAQFWEFDSFFKQIVRNDVDRYDAQSGRMVDDFSELTYRDFSGPVFYETRAAEMKVSYPAYFGREIGLDTATNRRLEFAKLICRDDPSQQLARSMVNRTWGQFFGYGFTKPVDDMGPHNAPSHPELLDRLTDEFVASNYDVQRLCGWICKTEAYQLTSRFTDKNHVDDPANGEVPLFSHMYVKSLTAEQLYDSLLIATGAHQAGQASYEEAQSQRERWLREFLLIFGGADDQEPTVFAGSIPQALMLMNGELVNRAVSADSGSYLNSVLNDSRLRSDNQRVQQLYLSALGRLPSRKEISQLGSFVKLHPNKLQAFQDVYWALLNSNEFVVNH
jgi:hypothetical protein